MNWDNQTVGTALFYIVLTELIVLAVLIYLMSKKK